MYLPEIVAHVREVVEERRRAVPVKTLERQAGTHIPRGFAKALRARAEQASAGSSGAGWGSGAVGQGTADRGAVSRGPAVIAELKKASPSKGLIREHFDAAALAAELEAAGAAALSVLTEERFFQGSLGNLQRASAAVKIPCLRKDFTVDPYQVVEARANGADAILLIAAALSDPELRGLREEARRYELDVLCEVHSREELERALPLECECVGVNSRDLRTFDVSLERACELAALLPRAAVRVAESGIHGRGDMDRLRTAGFEAFLVGESLMRQESPGTALQALLAPEAGCEGNFAA